jgi:hypothetical protein
MNNDLSNLFSSIEFLREFEFSKKHIFSVVRSGGLLWGLAFFICTTISVTFPVVESTTAKIDATPWLDAAFNMGMTGIAFGILFTLLCVYVFYRAYLSDRYQSPFIMLIPCAIAGVLLGTAVQLFLLPYFVSAPFGIQDITHRLIFCGMVTVTISVQTFRTLVKPENN